ncbi:type I polyketide synthase [Pedobacter cryoconitis]|uniref:Acyl transferase domain-containing protein/NAD(P)H-dependent flavin oxidoreductase YrpB (Nitropropane dioxygenase family)/NAD(P)-dependent dehydrogenase (Short-subunit alcohol dehydrogenase family) n=1 Tax=Pedobacter cryoconitis TaxID=188932 RepID=A0A7X0IZ06_9SPHI|nr:type I polyketide synthase [Pedobacter cryoconitis]MBB6498059.1 acyl transferase domain-containing protein/NAD(P)H-dependent flavin oxidoreductase YrpB (nitropropane dioxygenase family)/NAD(P)-dependent dehydrogenase (short-subunit alcohol dehydrogenase family) [Pedobacter cryoconitis]
MENLKIIGITPFEKPDAALAIALNHAGFFSVLNAGYLEPEALSAINKLVQSDVADFGICFPTDNFTAIALPEQVSLVIIPYGMKFKCKPKVKMIYQVYDLQSAKKAKAEGADGIIVKGNEGAGKVAQESSFVLFQRIIQEVKDIPVWVQGGIGIHTAAAVLAQGAAGIILDSQLALFPECSAPKSIKEMCSRLSGTETKLIDNCRILSRPNSPVIAHAITYSTLTSYFTDFDLETSYLPLGQDITLSSDLYNRYKKLDKLVFGLEEAIYGHLNQAKSLNVISPKNPLAKELNLVYPIAQGPMTRVSDVARFADAVSGAGGLSFIALSLLKGDTAKELIKETKRLAGTKTWGVGILGFAPQELRDEQMQYILEEKPPVVLIAGGRPSQAKPLEKVGIKTFLHVPSASLLDMFLKEGAKRFVFEGRECGGHVGPLSSLVLWEKQIERLLKEDNPEQISVFFAGGIHDAFSSAFIAVMAAPLAAKGMKVGVLMGTAYLYTTEAVTTGAIQDKFQEQALKASDTILLETAPGHETRCLKSQFSDFFTEEKEKLQQSGIDKKEIWAKLETLNVGRLRIAAKGIERRGDKLVTINEEEQLTLGMYMIGQVAAMRHQVVSVLELHQDVAEGNFRYIRDAVLSTPPQKVGKPLDVAIVGMACIFPGAKNIEEYWRNIILGKDSVTEVPDERWNKELYYDPASTAGDMSHSKWGGFIPRIDFDPLEFGIPPQSLAAIEPTQLLTLMVAKQAMENAGYQDGGFDQENVSVIIGAEGGNDLANSYGFRCFYKQVFGEMPEEIDQALPKMTEDSFPGILANVISGRVANRLNLGGRNFTVDAACASSLAAVDLACQELFLGKSDMVLAGGADLHNGINDYLMFSSTHALSRKGRCATFDGDADGIALGEGIAMIVLKRYDDALRDGDRIYSVIKGVGGSSDGKSLGLTAPRKNGQVQALERAYDQAGITPSVVGLVEAHGTGTVVGDKTELSALTDKFIQAGAIAGQAHLGSVKTQIGHTKCAAGLAGLIKASLAVYHGVKPPTIHLKNPNSYYNSATSPFAFHTEAGLWMDEKRYAGVSAFGFGGTNFHAVIESDHTANPSFSALRSWPSELFVFRGDNYEEAKSKLTAVKTLLDSNAQIDLKDIAYSLAMVNDKPIQLCIVADRPEDLIMKVELTLSGIESKDTYALKKREGKVAFMFPGQGSQRINMARDLFVIFPEMRDLLKDLPHYEKVLFPNAVFNAASLNKQKENIKDTRMAQPLLGIVDLAIANFLRTLGIVPDMVAGHSYGELPALCFAGAFAEDQLVALSAARAIAILEAVEDGDTGAMVAVNAKQEDLLKVIADLNDVYIVNYNSPMQSVLAGSTPAIQHLTEVLREARISFRQLEVACAFHSPLVAKSKGLYQQVLENVTFNDLELPVWSNTTAQEYPVGAREIKERLTDHLIKPVKFVDQVQQMYADGARIFIEVGPGKVLSGLTKACLGKDELILHAEDNGQNKLTHLLCMLATYVSTGNTIHIEKLFEGRGARLLNLDEPSLYKKSPAVWFVNGQHAIPSNGKLPSNGALPIIEPIQMKNKELRSESVQPVQSANEQMMQEYLNSMKLLIQAQRDVMLTFLGQNIPFNNQITNPLPVPQPVLAQPSVQADHFIPAVQQVISEPAAVKAIPVQKDVKLTLLQIVSDKTGYPQDMLGMEMDLEADLSIDSIKRLEIIGALRTELGGFSSDKSEDTVMEQLAGIKTLNGLVNWISENAIPESNNVSATINIEVTVKNNQPKFSSEELKAAILSVVSEKTGYPEEMLGMDLDLEADLSIDSIKRMEIIGELKLKIGFSQAQDQQDDLMEKLAAIKTLNGLVNWIADIESETDEVLTEAKKIIEESVTDNTVLEKLSRLRFELTPAALSDIEAAILKGQRFAVTDDGNGQAQKIKSLFKKHGAAVNIVSAGDDLQNYEGLIILNMFASEKKPGIIDHFEMIKQLDFEKIKWVYLISDTKCYLNEDADIELLRHYQGYSGFFKSLDREYDNTKCRIVSLETKMSAEAIADITLNEILNPDKPSEIIYHGNQRQIMELIPAELITGLEDSHIQLDKDAVVLVLGGAQGITAELMIHFAKDYPCTYILVGRSADPKSEIHGTASSLKTKDEIRSYLIKQGGFKKPAELEKETARIYKNNQILNSIAMLENGGSKVVYESLDLRDEEGLSQFVDRVYKDYGRIDGVVHGAGLLEDKLFHSKTSASFERVFDTKVTPLRVLAEKLKPETQFVILFSSIASVYGNRGQTDYAAANSVMDRYAWALKEKINGKVMSINWGPWKGAGMVSPTLEKEYERRGIALIPLQDGMETFLNELKYGKESQVLIMAGNNW